MAESLTSALQNYHINTLQLIANQLGLKPDRRPAHKAWLLRELSLAIPKLARSREFVRSLDEADRLALAATLKANRVCTVRDVAIPLMLADLIRVEGLLEGRGRPTAVDVLQRLLHLGFIVNETPPFGGSALRTFEPLQRFSMPSEVSLALRNTLPPARRQREEQGPQPEAPAVVREGTPQRFLKLLFFVWAELRREPARLLKAGGPGKRDRRRIAAASGLNDDDAGLDQVSELYDMLVALHMIVEDEKFGAAAENDAITLFWNTTPARQMHDLISAYTQLQAPLKPTTAEGTHYDGRAGITPRPPQELRDIIVKTLSEAAGQGWLAFPWLMALLTGGQPGSLALDTELWEIIFNSVRWYGEAYLKNTEKDLRSLETSLTLSVLQELHLMGIVDLGYDAASSKTPSAVRVTPAAEAYFAGRSGTEIASEPTGQVVLQPDFQVLAMGPVPLRVLAMVEQFAEREKIGESVIAYRITRDAAYRAFQRGETAETIVGYLEEATGQAIAQNVMRSIEEWQQQHERIVVRREVTLMQVDSAELLEQLLADKELGRLLHRVSDRAAWFPVAAIGRVQAHLQALEYLPAYSQDAEADLDRSLRWSDDTLVPRMAVPSLYVSGTLRRIAERHDDHWRITPDSVRTAVELGVDPMEIIALVETMTGAPLADGWDKQIKSWGHHFGGGETAQVRLLRLDREDALSELRREDAKLRRWVRPLPGTQDLAVVDEAHWEEVIALLHSWGIEVKPTAWW